MPVPRPDPAPRTYPASVFLHRRANGGPAVAGGTSSIAEVEGWLLADALGEEDVLPFFEPLCWRLAAAGLPLDRASLHVGTRHRRLYGFGWNWNRVDGLCDEVRVAEAALANDSYRRNPLFYVIEHGEAFRGRPGNAAQRFPLMAELARQGDVDYAAIPCTRAAQKSFGLARHGLAGGVAYYPGCNPAFDTGIDVPVLLLAGDKDDWTPAATCRRTVAGLAQPGLVEAVYYPNAYHSFDSRVADRNVPGAAGKTHHLAYDPAAAPDAEARARAFFARVLQ